MVRYPWSARTALRKILDIGLAIVIGPVGVGAELRFWEGMASGSWRPGLAIGDFFHCCHSWRALHQSSHRVVGPRNFSFDSNCPVVTPRSDYRTFGVFRTGVIDYVRPPHCS